jgi:predicted O-methyltransferase YrrM
MNGKKEFTGSLRSFLWGDCDPYKILEHKPSPPGSKGWYSDHPIFEKLIKERRPKRIIEVGSLFGASAIHMGELLKRNKIDAELTCVDTFLGSRETFFEFREYREAMLRDRRYSFFEEFLGNIEQAGFKDLINPFCQTSTNAARILTELGAKFDLIYIDASHEYLDVLNDLRLWHPLLADGGVLIGDDFEDPWYGIIRAAMEFADEIKQPLETYKAFASSPAGGRENTKYIFYKS